MHTAAGVRDFEPGNSSKEKKPAPIVHEIRAVAQGALVYLTCKDRRLCRGLETKASSLLGIRALFPVEWSRMLLHSLLEFGDEPVEMRWRLCGFSLFKQGVSELVEEDKQRLLLEIHQTPGAQRS